MQLSICFWRSPIVLKDSVWRLPFFFFLAYLFMASAMISPCAAFFFTSVLLIKKNAINMAILNATLSPWRLLAESILIHASVSFPLAA